MTQILILSTSILAIGPIVDIGDSLQTPDITYPKSTIPDCQIEDVSLPDGFSIQTYEWVSGQVQKIPIPIPSLTPEQANQNYIGMMESRADALEAAGNLLDALILRESLK